LFFVWAPPPGRKLRRSPGKGGGGFPLKTRGRQGPRRKGAMPIPQAPPAEHVGGGVNCLDDTFSLVRAELLAQEREIQELQAEISQLKVNGPVVPRVVQDVADTFKVAVEPEEGEEDGILKPKRASILDAGDDHKIHVALYEFDQSMWDAGLLLCFHHTGALDKFLLFIGVVLNLALQLGMLMVVELSMLDNPWTTGRVSEMLKWRVNSGHRQFFPDSGETLSQRLCSRKLWNFQQEVYNEVYDYLSKPVPGVVLSFLAVALWMLTIMMEYRSCVEQALGVWHLPSLKSEDEFEEVTDDGEIVVRGISPCLRAVAIVILIIPRLVIMSSLAVVGSIYVAQTASLADIVLNCLALAFVLDVDELVAQVLLTEKLRGLLTKIQPIDCGKTTSRRAPFQDVFRLGLTFAGVGLCVVMILFPFKENVESAAAVLCGGNLDFSYTGGVEADPAIVLRPMNFGTDTWDPSTADCPDADELFYLKKYYLPNLTSTGNRSNTNSTTIVRSSSEWDDLKLKHVWNFLLHPETSKCPEGQILAPQIDGDGENGPPPRVCQKEFPPALRASLDDLKVQNAGLGPIVATCPRFNPSAGCAASEKLPEACHWSWLSQRCDQEAPGLMHGQGCQADWFIQCETWEWFNATHPTINCGIYDICGADEFCGVMTGDVTLVFPNIDAARNNISAVITSTQRALANLTSTTTDQVTVTEATSRRLQNSTNGTDSNSSIKFNYEITELPVTVFPERVVQQSAVLISRINIGLRAANISVQSAAFQAPQTITRERLQEIKCGGDGDGGGGCYGGGGGYGGDDGGFDGDDGGFGGDDGDAGDDNGDQDGGDGNGDDSGNQDGGDDNGDGGNGDGIGDGIGDDGGNQDGDGNGEDGGNQDGGDDSGSQDGGDNTGDDGGDQDGGDNSTDDSEGNQGGGDNTGDDSGDQDGGDNSTDDSGDPDGGDNNTDDSEGNQDGGDNTGGNNGDDGGNQDGGDNTGDNNGDDGGNQDGGDGDEEGDGDDGAEE